MREDYPETHLITPTRSLTGWAVRQVNMADLPPLESEIHRWLASGPYMHSLSVTLLRMLSN